MLPTPSDVHVDQPLSNISIAYLQDQTRFVADRVFPVVPVQRQSDRYYTYDRGDWNRDDMQERAPSTESAGAGFRLDNTPTYYCREYALHRDIPDQVMANADVMLDPLRESVLFLTLKALLRREKNWTSTYFKAGVWSNGLAGVSASPNSSQFLQWNDNSSDPIKTIRAGATTILESTGIAPNTLVLGKRTYDGLLDNVAVLDRIKYSTPTGQAAQMNPQLLAQLFEVDRVLVMSGIENTAAEGAPANHSFISGKGALLTYAAPDPGLMTPSGGYTFAWNNLGYVGQLIRQFRMDALKANRIEIESNFDQRLISADLGFFFDSAVA